MIKNQEIRKIGATLFRNAYTKDDTGILTPIINEETLAENVLNDDDVAKSFGNAVADSSFEISQRTGEHRSFEQITTHMLSSLYCEMWLNSLPGFQSNTNQKDIDCRGCDSFIVKDNNQLLRFEVKLTSGGYDYPLTIHGKPFHVKNQCSLEGLAGTDYFVFFRKIKSFSENLIFLDAIVHKRVVLRSLQEQRLQFEKSEKLFITSNLIVEDTNSLVLNDKKYWNSKFSNYHDIVKLLE